MTITVQVIRTVVDCWRVKVDANWPGQAEALVQNLVDAEGFDPPAHWEHVIGTDKYSVVAEKEE
jgi:hypothetical protein